MGQNKLECLSNVLNSVEKMLRTNTLAYFVQLSSITEESFLTLKRQDIDINILRYLTHFGTMVNIPML
jgi:hypothetical protein